MNVHRMFHLRGRSSGRLQGGTFVVEAVGAAADLPGDMAAVRHTVTGELHTVAVARLVPVYVSRAEREHRRSVA